jgi:hypothetical protein
LLHLARTVIAAVVVIVIVIGRASVMPLVQLRLVVQDGGRVLIPMGWGRG